MKPKLPKGNYSEGFLKFFDYCLDFAKKHGKTIDIKNSSYVVCEGKCGGYCDGAKVVIAGKVKHFTELFAHELSHLHQSVENEKLWLDGAIEIDKLEICTFDEYFKVIKLERDCEIRALKFGKKYNLFDLENYAKKANSYLFFHLYMFLKGGWIYSKKLGDPRILALMPSKIVSEKELKSINMDLMLVYDKVIRGKS